MKKHVPHTEVIKQPDIDPGENAALAKLIDGYKAELRPKRLIEQQTTAWLKDNGLNDQYLARLPKEQLHALQTCHHLLSTIAGSLTAKQRRTLKNYRRTVRNEKLRHTVTQGHTYAVLNIGKKLNRQLFTQSKNLTKTRAI